MTPMQAAAFAFVTAAAVLALYFLKVRRRSVLVSSAILWKRVLADQSARSVWQRLRLMFSILVALTISLLIALSIARPRVDWLTGKPQRIVIVMDTSPSMNTRTSDGRTRWLHAVDEARALLDRTGPSDEFRIAETSGHTTFGFTFDPREARAMIDTLSPAHVEPRFPVLDGNESHVYFISDGVALRDLPRIVESVSVFEAAGNAGITAFDIRPLPSDPLAYEAYLEIDNSGEEKMVGITISGGEADRITRTISIRPGERYREAFDVSRFRGGPVQASILSKDDALASDDQAIAYLPARRKIRTLLVTPGNSRLTTLLNYDPNVELSVANPANYRELPDVDAYIFDRYTPVKQPAQPALLLGGPVAGGRVVQHSRITSWSEQHPVMQHVGLQDVSIQKVFKIDTGKDTVIASSNDTPLILTSENPRRVMITFDLRTSDFPLQAGFPVFVHNALAWLSEEHRAMHTANPLFFDVNESALEGHNFTLPRASLLHRELWFYMVAAAIALLLIEWLTYYRRITL
jgi:Ca-activated chloride channel family protein